MGGAADKAPRRSAVVFETTHDSRRKLMKEPYLDSRKEVERCMMDATVASDDCCSWLVGLAGARGWLGR